jgi:hypothetical protein
MSVKGDTVFLSGNLNSRMANEFERLDMNLYKRIVVDSQGGVVSESLRIAKKISSSKATLIIRGSCMSACASIILPAAHRRVMEPDSVVAFHGTQYGLNRLYEITRSRDRHRFTQSPQVGVLAKQEYAIYREADVDPRLLLSPYTERGRLCYLEAKRRDGSNRFAVLTEKPAFVIDVPTLAAFGLEVSEAKSEELLQNSFVVSPEQVERKFNSISISKCDSE